MKFYLKINGTHSYTVDKQVKRIDEKDVEFMQFPSASRAALHVNWIKQSGFDVQKYEIVPADQPLEIQPALMYHPDGKTYFTTGAYIQRISYVNRQGQTVFGWIVTSFESDTYCDGDYAEVSDYGTFLDALTPPANDEERKTEYIIQSLQSFGLKRIELGLYKTMLEAENSTIYVRKLDSISSAGQITQIESTLDEFLLDCPHFSQTTREILVDTFGRDRLNIFITPENVLVIGSCRANIWMVTEHPHKYIPPAKEEKEEAQQDDLPPKERIRCMLLNYGVTKLDLEEYCKTGYGYIATVYTEMVEYAHGDAEYYENIEDDVLEDLVIAVEMQIEANEKAFKRCQD